MYKVYDGPAYIESFELKEVAINFINSEAMAGNDISEYWIETPSPDRQCQCGSGEPVMECQEGTPYCG